MKTNNELLILVGLLVLMYINPGLMATFVNNVLGKIFILAGIVYLTEKNTILGLLLVVIFIASMQSTVEGMGTADAAAEAATTPSNTQDESDTDATGDPSQPPPTNKKAKMNKENLTTLKPAVVTSGRELLSIDEMLRPTESNMLPVNKPMGSPPSENLLDGQLDLMTPVKMNGTINRGYLPAIF